LIRYFAIDRERDACRSSRIDVPPASVLKEDWKY
jgi:hypothetical protein